MKNRHRTLTATLLVCMVQPASAQYAEIVGAYKSEDGQTCQISQFQGSAQEDPLFGSVCVPWTSIGRFDTSVIQMAIAELVDPALLQRLVIEKMLGNAPVAEAYEVEVDRKDGSVFDLTDGAVLRTLETKYIGYLGYHEEAIVFRDGGDWHLCVDGEVVEVEVLRDPSRSYNRRRISATRNEILQMRPCR